METQSNTKKIYVCTECGSKYSTKTNINNHMKRKHKDHKPATLKKTKCPLCSEFLSSCAELDKHITSYHNLTLEQENLKFNTHEEFREWKLRIEANSQSSYVVLRTKTLADRSKITYYVCHRSGNYIPNLKKKQRQRQPKLKGSNKIQCNCPARITARMSYKGDIKVSYTSTHIGHKQEVGKLRMTSVEREKIAGKLLQGIPNYKVLKDIGENFNPLTRISYTTHHDLYNIKKAFKIESDVIFDQDDTKSVSILVEKLKNSSGLDNPILLFKPYGQENNTIGKNNFLLIFMNTAQKEMLVKYGNNIIMIDATHGTNPYKIQLTTLMVVDEDYEGFPVSFLWSVTQTESIYQIFFSCLKEKLPELKPRIFMSDDCNTFYNAFSKVYEYFPNKVLCDWHVKRNLFDNLTKISLVEKRNEVKKKIKLMVNELDEQAFHKMMNNLIINLTSDEDTRKYAEYFALYYAKRPEQWAHCFRKDYHKNTNMCLEKWHQEIKHNRQMGGRCQRRLDVGINNVLECLRMKFLRRLVSMSRSRVPYKLAELRKRHKLAEQFAHIVEVFEETSGKKWFVASSKNKNNTKTLEYYTVEQIKDTQAKCQCNFHCNKCKCCLHSYSCSCHDYTIQYNMCKHIHMVCLKYSSQQNICSYEENMNIEGDSLLPIDDNNINGEHKFISTHLCHNTKKKIESEKRETLENLKVLAGLITKSNNIEQISYTSKNIKTIISCFKAIETTTKASPLISTTNHPHNKKSELQNRRLPVLVTNSLNSLKRKKKRRVHDGAVFNNDETLELNLVL